MLLYILFLYLWFLGKLVLVGKLVSFFVCYFGISSPLKILLQLLFFLSLFFSLCSIFLIYSGYFVKSKMQCSKNNQESKNSLIKDLTEKQCCVVYVTSLT